MGMKINSREANGITIVDLDGKITLGEGRLWRLRLVESENNSVEVTR